MKKFRFTLRNGGKRLRFGAALVIVLGAVVLVTVMALAFMASVAIERQSAAGYASGMEARMYGESAVNLVMGQIRQASERDLSVWTSQPGLLRTFSMEGEPEMVYKLYSAQTSSLPAKSFDPGDDIPSDWSNRPAEYVDLNRAIVTRTSGVASTNFPILDPRGVGKIDGFATNSSPSGVAMPVAWLYVLKDGTLTSSTGMTKENPPVARMAFWTDDETCKLNINTASEGSYWDIPRTTSKDDRRMVSNQPAQHEFQAYPGHPATTSLSPVLWKYFSEKDPALVLSNSEATTNTFPEVLYSMLPRTQSGGSRGGTVQVSLTNTAIPMKNERFFTSVDELAFLAPAKGSTNRSVNPYVTRDVIEQTRFFLTANSRAPELNLFNLPRVSIWPIHSQTNSLYRTPFDNLIAFASTINSNAYYFTRADPYSATKDFSGRNVQIYEYLQRLTGRAEPGFGSGSFFSKYGSDRDQILTEIFDYVRCANLTDTSTGDTNFRTFTTNRYTLPNDSTLSMIPVPGLGQVVPIAPQSGSGAGTRGFGRIQTLNRAILALVALRDVVSTNTVPVMTNATVAQAVLLLETFSPALGHTISCPNYEIALNTTVPFTVLSQQGTNAPVTNSFSFAGTNVVNDVAGGILSANVGGYEGFAPNTLMYYNNTAPLWHGVKTSVGNTSTQFPFVSSNFNLGWNSATNPTFQLRGGHVTAQIRLRKSSPGGGAVIQTVQFNFPDSQWITNLPIPTPTSYQPNGFADRLASAYMKTNVTGNIATKALFLGASSPYWLTTNDVVRSLEPNGSEGGGDLRLLAAKTDADTAKFFGVIPGYEQPTPRQFTALAAQQEIEGTHTLFVPGSGPVEPDIALGANGNHFFGRLVAGSTWEKSGADSPVHYPWTSLVPAAINGVRNKNGDPGDWDTGHGWHPNGPYINKPDEGSIARFFNGEAVLPYVDINQDNYSMPPGQAFSSPSRQIPSAVMFGSLPTGVKANNPWQTLLFCPNPASGAKHPGALSPKDHLLLDLFTMPVVEPYAISEPFATSGKVNMNYQIIPFTDIERKTALYGMMRATKVTAIPGVDYYKRQWGINTALTNSYRYPINVQETLKYFDARFQTNGAFLSASEICDIPLIPDPSQPSIYPYPWSSPVTRGNIDEFWDSHLNTGDNVREDPYKRIYPRLTTRSNTYTVHVWVQTLKKVPSTPADQWIEGRDKITGEFRGSYTIERYIQPADTDIPDAATLVNGDNFNRFYRYRIINAAQFNP